MRRSGSSALRRGRGRGIPAAGRVSAAGRLSTAGAGSAAAPVGFGESSSSEDDESGKAPAGAEAADSMTADRACRTGGLPSASESVPRDAVAQDGDTAPPATAAPVPLARQDSIGKKRPRANKGRIFLPAAASDPFLEQLKQRKEEVELERGMEPPGPSSLDNLSLSKKGSFDVGDPSTTNIFVGNLHPRTDERALVIVFARFGPVASLKIMWPRTEEEHARGYNSGFVSFIERLDAEAAFQGMHETEIDGNVVRLEWGKAMPRVRDPLPLPAGHRYGGSATKPLYGTDAAMEMADKSLPRIIVQPPLDLARRRDINRLAFSVAKVKSTEGSGAVEVESRIIAEERASGRSRFSFLWDDDDSNEDGVYYRWRVYSLSHDDTDVRWRTAPFAMVPGGPLWDPPPCARPINNPPVAQAVEADKQHSAAAGNASDEVKDPDETLLMLVAGRDDALSVEDREELHEILGNMTCERANIAVGMVFCLDRARCAGDIAATIARRLLSLHEREASAAEAVGIVYLITDVVHNSAYTGIVGASAHRERLGALSQLAFGGVGRWLQALPGRMAVHNASARLEAVFTAWARSKYFPPDVIDSLKISVFGALDKAQSVSMAVADFQSGRQ